jgi:hypothetical protein
MVLLKELVATRKIEGSGAQAIAKDWSDLHRKQADLGKKSRRQNEKAAQPGVWPEYPGLQSCGGKKRISYGRTQLGSHRLEPMSPGLPALFVPRPL